MSALDQVGDLHPGEGRTLFPWEMSAQTQLSCTLGGLHSEAPAQSNMGP